LAFWRDRLSKLKGCRIGEKGAEGRIVGTEDGGFVDWRIVGYD
jgi:hypothetical protein